MKRKEKNKENTKKMKEKREERGKKNIRKHFCFMPAPCLHGLTNHSHTRTELFLTAWVWKQLRVSSKLVPHSYTLLSIFRVCYIHELQIYIKSFSCLWNLTFTTVSHSSIYCFCCTQTEFFWVVTPCSVVVGYQRSGWRRKQHGRLKRRYPTTTLHGVTTQKPSTWNITAMKVTKLETL